MPIILPFFVFYFRLIMLTHKPPLNALLLLKDGTRLEGLSAGAQVTISGELCFNTAMTGYQETFTDPSYFGQILISTHVHIGNYGYKPEESESDKIQINGLICRNLSFHSSRMGAQPLSDWFNEHKKPIMYGVDTRALVKKIRNEGAINAALTTDPNTSWEDLISLLNKTPSMEGLNLSKSVSSNEIRDLGPENASFKVALIDFGFKRNIVRCLLERNSKVRIFPMETELTQILDWQPHGILLSNGPGDPASMPDQIKLVADMVKTGLPIFGICLGHQLLALSQGLRTVKMHHGHRGINHPILNKLTGKGEITSQNHGFAVTEIDLKDDNVEVTHVHLNDHTIAGIKFKDRPIFSVQYHPESAPGPHDSRYLFDLFFDNLNPN